MILLAVVIFALLFLAMWFIALFVRVPFGNRSDFLPTAIGVFVGWVAVFGYCLLRNVDETTSDIVEMMVTTGIPATMLLFGWYLVRRRSAENRFG